MGLSRRWRADKSASSRKVRDPVQPHTFEDCRDDFKNRGQSSCGTTLRKTSWLNVQKSVCGVLYLINTLPCNYKRVKMQPVHHGEYTNILPRVKKLSASELFSKPNSNHGPEYRVSVANSHFDFRVEYSLNKKSRWNIEKQIALQCQTGEGNLQDYNLFVIDTNWRVESQEKLLTKRLATNIGHMRLAASELQTRLKSSCKSNRPDKNASFSDKVAQAHRDRHLVSFSSRRGQVNAKSMLREFELPQSDFDDAEKLRLENSQRKNLWIEIKKAPKGKSNNKVPHSIFVETNFYYRRAHRRAQERRCHSKRLLDDDFCDFESVYDDDCEIENEQDADESYEECSVPARPVATATVFGALRFMNSSSNFETKLKETAEQQDWILIDEDDDAADDTPNDTLSNDVNSVLLHYRPTLSVEPHLVSPERLEQLFADTDSLCVSNSQPRMYSVILQHDLSDTVSFEVVGEKDGYTRLAMRYSQISTDSDSVKRQRNFAAKIASMSDPFAFLRGLLPAKPKNSRRAGANQPQHGHVPVGWCRTVVWNEVDARVAALRALPMFNKSSIMAPTKARDAIKCGICDRPFKKNEASIKFSVRSTCLGDCGHRFCNSCWVRHVTCCISSGAASVECPSSDCRTVIDAAVLLCFCPHRLFPALVGAAFRAWQRRLPVSRFCPLLRCGRFLVAADEQDKGNNVLCCCWTSFCLMCGQDPHWPVDCATAERYLEEMAVKGCGNIRTRDLFAVALVTAKKCPGCGAAVEKSEGCSHMSCACGQLFCWNCGAQRSMGHVCGEQRAAFIHKKFFAEDDLLAPSSERSFIYAFAIKVRRARQKGPRQLEGQANLTVRLLSAAGRSPDIAEKLIADALRASYLLEYTCVLLDAIEANHHWQSELHSVGETIQQLLRSFHAQLQPEGRGLGNVRDAKVAEQVCDKLFDLHRQLQTECEQLREMITRFGG